MAISREAALRARIALQRFGLGPKPGALERIADDPVAALKAELDLADVALIRQGNLPSVREAGRASQQGDFNDIERIRQRELRARIEKHLSVEIGFVERLVLFWSNHFSMSINKDGVIWSTYGQLERDVIRKHVLGKFANMHRGVMLHPAMIRYLDNEYSIGPNSKRGLEWGSGFNENLARELLELHTVGSGGGYSEADVTAMAKIITGWSYVQGWQAKDGWEGATRALNGQFLFRPDWHEPGPIELMGKSYPEGGLAQGEAVLRDLAAMPATAQHIAFKLVRHFVTDEPTPEMVEPVAAAYRNSAGDLKTTARALIDLPAAWSGEHSKIRTPYELAIGQFRALGVTYTDDNMWAFTEPLRAMDHLPWERPAPDGYSDENYTWLDPDGITIRLDTAMLSVDVLAERFRGTPLKLAKSLYGESMSSDLADALTWITDKRVGLTLLFMSPEFQRR